jgi:natural product biosynthesis luciferase-like monooxygenase protein
VILEAPPEDKPAADDSAQKDSTSYVLALSARTEPALHELARLHGEWLETHPRADPASLVRTVNTGRSHFEYRAALTFSSLETAIDGLHVLARGKTPPNASRGVARFHERPAVAFLFTGQGAQHAGMGHRLFESEPVFRDAVLRCEKVLQPLVAGCLTDLLFAADEGALVQTAVAQPALFALEYALTELWASWGVLPDYLLGHSLGEYVAACVAGIFSLEDALRLVVGRGQLMQELPGDGAMAAIFADEAKLLPILAGREDRLAIAALNAPAETVLSGVAIELETAMGEMARAGVAARRLAVSHAFHSPLMRPMLAKFERLLAGVTFSPPSRAIAANVTGALDVSHAMAGPAYWLQQIVSPVRFHSGLATLAGAGARIFIEIGPRPVLTMLGRKIFPDPGLTWVPALCGLQEDGTTPLIGVAELYAAGIEIDWEALHRYRGGRKLGLPTYPFQRRRFWLPQVKKQQTPAACTEPPAVTLNPPVKGIHFSVMFFAATQDPMDGDKYRLVLEAARFADRHGFASVWVPERHFTNMGSLYPNPAVLHAALARETRRVRLMAGSVVAPLHHPIRLAEEWAMVDNLSGGRVGLSFASGWNPDDFAFFPERYAGRREMVYEALAMVRQLWRGEEIEITNGVGRRARVRIFPTPLQKELPFWITAAGNPQTFRKAGELGANLLTHLLDQDLSDLAEKIRLYREARAMCGHDPEAGCVTIMVHTFVGPELATTQEAVREPFCNYLKASRGLLTGLAQSRGRQVDTAALSEGDLDDLVKFLFERFASTRALLGTPASCELLVRRLVAAGVNEIASLLDFGQKVDDVIGGLPWLRMLKERVESSPVSAADTPVELTRQRPLVERELPSEWFYELAWRVLPPPAVRAETRVGRWLIFADNSGFSVRLATVLGPKQCVLVRHGPNPSGDTEFWVDSRRPNGVSSFFGEHGPEIADVTGVIFLWPLDTMRTDELETASLARCQCLTVEGARQLVQGLVEAVPGKALEVWWITCGATQKAPSEHVLAVAQAPLLGFARGVSLEHPEWRSGVVDLDPLASVEANAALLAAHMGAADHEEKVAFRGGALWGERLVRVEPPTKYPQCWECRPDGAYLITGGLGGVGLKLAEWLVERGARHLLLVGRSSPSPAAQQAIESLEVNGSTVMVAAADVVDEIAMTTLLQNWQKAGRPPIRGVMHAAGLWHDVPVDHMDAATLAAVLAPKMAGTWVLERVLADQALDFFVSFSSLSSLWPAYGQTNYAAANAFLDAHALWRRSVGRQALSVNWGPWADVGFGATKQGLRAHERLEAFGMRRLPPSDALDALGWLLAGDLTQGVVVKMDWAMLTRVDPRLAHTPFLSEVTSGFGDAQSLATADSDLARHLELAPPAEHSALVQGAVASIAARVLHIGAGELRVDEPLRNLGLDSLMAVEIKNRVQAETGVNVPLARFLEGASVAALAVWVQTEIKLSRLTRTEGPGAETAVMEELAL